MDEGASSIDYWIVLAHCVEKGIQVGSALGLISKTGALFQVLRGTKISIAPLGQRCGNFAFYGAVLGTSLFSYKFITESDRSIRFLDRSHRLQYNNTQQVMSQSTIVIGITAMTFLKLKRAPVKFFQAFCIGEGLGTLTFFVSCCYLRPNNPKHAFHIE